MKQSKRGLSLLLVSWTCLIVTALWSAPAVSVSPQPQVLSGHVPRITKRLSPQGRLDANYRVEMAIGLPLRNRGQLTNLLHDIYDPSSPRFRHFLKADEFATSFGPTPEDYQSVIDFANAHHLTVTHAHSNRTLVDISGSVADIEKAFKVHMQIFKHPQENRNFFAPDVEPSLDLKTPVLAISGLDNYVKPRPRIHTLIGALKPGVRRPLGGGGGGGGGGDYTGPFEGYDFRFAYAANVSEDGTGQSVGLFELFGFSSQDIQDYEDAAGIFLT